MPSNSLVCYKTEEYSFETQGQREEASVTLILKGKNKCFVEWEPKEAITSAKIRSGRRHPWIFDLWPATARRNVSSPQPFLSIPKIPRSYTYDILTLYL